MRVLRTILASKHHFLNPSRFSPPPLISFRPLLQNPQFPRHDHTASSLKEDSEDNGVNNRPSWSNYAHVFKDGQKNRSDSEEKVEKKKGFGKSKAKEAYTSPPSSEQSGVGGIRSIRVGSKKNVKGKTNWVCTNCGYTSGQWWGVCRSCNVSGMMKEFHEAKSSDKVSGFSVSENVLGSWLPQQSGELRPLRLAEVNRGLNHQEWRIPL